MAFIPKSETHSIAEVNFALQINSELSLNDFQALKSAADTWKDLITKTQESQLFAVIGPEEDSEIPNFAPPIKFMHTNSAEEVEWELLLEFRDIVVRCYHYTSWEQVWKKAKLFIERVFSALQTAEYSIVSANLVYLDVFQWSGEESAYDVRKILNGESEYVPVSIFEHESPVWHLYQGWYSEVENPIAGRILERLHIDSIRENNRILVKFENLNRFLFGSAVNPQQLLGSGQNEIDRIFEILHDVNKSTLRKVLQIDLQEKINLNATKCT